EPWVPETAQLSVATALREDVFPSVNGLMSAARRAQEKLGRDVEVVHVMCGEAANGAVMTKLAAESYRFVVGVRLEGLASEPQYDKVDTFVRELEVSSCRRDDRGPPTTASTSVREVEPLRATRMARVSLSAGGTTLRALVGADAEVGDGPELSVVRVD